MSWERIRNLFRPHRLTDEIDEELRFHIESSIAAGIASGMTPGEARRDAIRRFGNPPAVRERTRDAALPRYADDLRKDLAIAIRTLRRRPSFTIVALLTLALGIGATTAMLTVVRSVLLRPAPFPNPERLFVISDSPSGGHWLYAGMSDRGYVAFREANRTFESLATFGPAQSTLTGLGEPVRLSGASVTTDFFRVLRVDAAAGRTFRPEDDRTEGEPVVVLGDSLWRTRFGANPAVLDTTIILDGTSHRVVGVLPAGFSYPAGAEYWIALPVRIQPNLGYTRPVIGRVKPGITRAQAQADLDVWARTLPREGDAREPVRAVTPLHEAMVGAVRLPVLVLGGAVLFVLLIVCANVANLLLMRAVARRQEIATRFALGAGRGRLVRQLLTESALLSLAGGLAGAALAALAGPSLLAAIPPARLPHDIPIQMDMWVLSVTAGLSLLTGMLVGLAPAVQIARDGQFSALREGTASPTRRSHRVRHALVVAQVALTLMLLVGAGLLVRSFAGLTAVPLGFEAEGVMTMTVDLPESRYPTAAEASALHDRVLEALSAHPGNESAAAVNWLPLGERVIWGDVLADHRRDLAGKYSATKVAVSAGYFETAGIRVLRGRGFTAQDSRGAPRVLVISESVARHLWGSSDPLGGRMALTDRPKSEQDWCTVVGVVEDVRQGGFRARPAHAVYQPYPQVTSRHFVGYMTFLLRTKDDPAALAPLMRAALHAADPQQAPQALAALESVIDGSVAEPKFQARLLTAFSVAALLLAALGIYGVLAASVLERRYEIGVRIALGADSSTVVRLILMRMLGLTGAGLALGLAGAFALTGVLRSLLFNITPTDAPTFAAAALVLASVSVAAAMLPARRAGAIDPVVALRAE